MRAAAAAGAAAPARAGEEGPLLHRGAGPGHATHESVRLRERRPLVRARLPGPLRRARRRPQPAAARPPGGGGGGNGVRVFEDGVLMGGEADERVQEDAERGGAVGGRRGPPAQRVVAVGEGEDAGLAELGGQEHAEAAVLGVDAQVDAAGGVRGQVGREGADEGAGVARVAEDGVGHDEVAGELDGGAAVQLEHLRGPAEAVAAAAAEGGVEEREERVHPRVADGAGGGGVLVLGDGELDVEVEAAGSALADDLGKVALRRGPAAIMAPEAAVSRDNVVFRAAAVLIRGKNAHSQCRPRVGACKGLGLCVKALKEVVGVSHGLERLEPPCKDGSTLDRIFPPSE